jgi:hypothetical protein
MTFLRAGCDSIPATPLPGNSKGFFATLTNVAIDVWLGFGLKLPGLYQLSNFKEDDHEESTRAVSSAVHGVLCRVVRRSMGRQRDDREGLGCRR